MFDDFDPSESENAQSAQNTQSTTLLETTNVWYEKYRPKTVQDVILPDYMKHKIQQYLQNGGFQMPHLGLFSRTPGTGKSSLAKAILNDTQAEALWINASLDKGIDILRTRIQKFASRAPLRNTVKIVVMDEFDHFTKDGQAAFRGFIDQFGDNVRFIFTGNYKENIIEPLLDRLEVYDFNQFSIQDIAKPILDRLEYILTQEGIEFKREDVVGIMRQDYPRIRKMIATMAQCTHDGKLEFAATRESSKLENLAALMQNKNLEQVRTAVYALGSSDHIYSWFGQHLDLCVKPEQHLNAIISLAKYQDMHNTAKDKLLNVLACCCELMRL